MPAAHGARALSGQQDPSPPLTQSSLGCTGPHSARAAPGPAHLQASAVDPDLESNLEPLVKQEPHSPTLGEGGHEGPKPPLQGSSSGQSGPLPETGHWRAAARAGEQPLIQEATGRPVGADGGGRGLLDAGKGQESPHNGWPYRERSRASALASLEPCCVQSRGLGTCVPTVPVGDSDVASVFRVQDRSDPWWVARKPLVAGHRHGTIRCSS